MVSADRCVGDTVFMLIIVNSLVTSNSLPIGVSSEQGSETNCLTSTGITDSKRPKTNYSGRFWRFQVTGYRSDSFAERVIVVILAETDSRIRESNKIAHNR